MRQHKITNQANWPGSMLFRGDGARLRRRMIRRWRRAMILPETVFFAVLILSVAWMSGQGNLNIRAGQIALAAGGASTGMTVIQDGMPSTNPDAKRKQKNLQQKLRRNPESLVSLTAGDVVQTFGYADLQRHEGNITILQFRGNGCVLDVYVDAVSSRPQHFEFRARQIVSSPEKADVRSRECVDDILKSRRV